MCTKLELFGACKIFENDYFIFFFWDVHVGAELVFFELGGIDWAIGSWNSFFSKDLLEFVFAGFAIVSACRFRLFEF